MAGIVSERTRRSWLRVVAVSSLIAVGQAQGTSQTGGLTQGGPLNALCFTSVNYDFTPFNLHHYTSPGSGANQVNYFITDGSGFKTSTTSNWAYSYYSVYDQSQNDNADGQNRVSYATPNWAVMSNGAYTGTYAGPAVTDPGRVVAPSPPPPAGPVAPPLPPVPGTAISTSTEEDSVSTGRQVRGYFDSHVKPIGIQKVVFPSKYLGIAVGAGTALSGPGSNTGSGYPNILISKDNGASWHQVTGVPSYTRSPPVAYYRAGPPVLFPMAVQGPPDLFGLHCASKSLCWTVGGNGALASAATGVRMDAAKNAVNTLVNPNGPAGLVSFVSGLFDWGMRYIVNPVPAVPLTSVTWDAPGVEPSYAFAYGYAQILITTNGGTVWRNVPVTYDQTTLYAAYAMSPAQGARVYGANQAGTLLAVHSDQAGLNVWAVGVSPYQMNDFDGTTVGGTPAQLYQPNNFGGTGATGAKFVFPVNGGANDNFLDSGAALNTPLGSFAAVTGYTGIVATHGVTDQPYGTILWSSNGGVSWSLQRPPTLATYFSYALFDVYVLKSNAVFAVGGSLNNPSGQAFTDERGGYPDPTSGTFSAPNGGTQRQPSQYIGPGFGNGIILAYNGQTWYQMTYPGMTYGNAPAFTCVTFNNGVGWVGGYTYNAGPLLNVFGQYEIIGGSPAASGALAVTATYPVNGTLAPYTVVGLSYTVLITLDQRTWTPAPVASFPPGFIERGADAAPQIPSLRVDAQQDIYGIVWDSANNGWMFGGGSYYKSGFILSTSDGGNTWKYETPPDILANGLHVKSCANVPISY